MDEHSFFKLPMFILTPFDLFSLAKDFKEKLQNKSSHPLHSKISTAITELNFASKNVEPCLQNAIATLVVEIREAFDQYPYHGEMYLGILRDTLKLVRLEGKNPPLLHKYNEAIDFVRDREPSSKMKILKELDKHCALSFLFMFFMATTSQLDNIQLGMNTINLMFATHLSSLVMTPSDKTKLTETNFSIAMYEVLQQTYPFGNECSFN